MKERKEVPIVDPRATIESSHERPAVVEDQHLRFLDGLRESGITNMFGAAPYLVELYSVSKKDAREILSYWMQTFSG